MEKTLLLEGQEFELLGNQRSGAAVYRGSGTYARVGERQVIALNLMQHREMEKAKFPVPQIVSEGEVGDKRYFLETSLGERSFRAIFQEEYERDGKISDTSFTKFLTALRRLFSAQLRSREPEWAVPDFAAGVGVTKLSQELPTYRKQIEERFVEVCERLKKLPGTIQHGDCNAANIYEGGIIDIEDSFKGPLGYDVISALMTIEWSPETRDHEFFAQYKFSPEQKALYAKTFTALCVKAGASNIMRFAEDLAFCRAIWLCVGLHAWPRIQQWRFEKFITTYFGE